MTILASFDAMHMPVLAYVAIAMVIIAAICGIVIAAKVPDNKKRESTYNAVSEDYAIPVPQDS